MSVDAQELERGALKRKDREQLLTIANALGHKPSSRTRKDQIIELILGSGEGSGAAAKPAAATPERRAPAGGSKREAQTEQLSFSARESAAADIADAAAPASAGKAERTGPDSSSRATLAVPSPAPNPIPTPTVDAAAAAPTSTRTVASFSPFEDADIVPMRRTRPPEPDPADTEPSAAAMPTTSRNGPAPAAASSRGAGSEATGAEGSATRVSNRSDADADDQNPAVRDRTAGRTESRTDGRTEGRTEGRTDGGTDGRAENGADGDGQAAETSGDGQGDRESSSRRRRRRGRDKDRDRVAPSQPVQAGNHERDREQNRDRDQNRERDQHRERDRDQNRDRDRDQNRDRDRDRDRSERVGEDTGSHSMEPVAIAGFLDLRDEGYGFLRVKGYLPSKEDVYVPAKFVRQLGLRKGDHLAGSSRPAGRGEKNPALLRIDQVNGGDPENARGRRRFEELTPLFPDQKLRLEQTDDPSNMTARIIDLISPIGKGQRGLIVSPPKAGKTTIMKTIAQAIEVNNPEVKLIVLLVDERPEEVTDMRRSVKGEVVASTFDRPADEHTTVVELTIERAKRMVEEGHDVVIILDGITRLARAYNLAAPATGRIMSGGIDTGALYPPKKFFGAARNVDEGGSLTILATALVETGSRMDEVIFEEFKGTGNMELRLDRRLAEKRIYPAIDVDASSTRHEELLFERRQLNLVWKLRRVLSGLAGDGGAGAGLELLVDRMKTFKSNDEFLAEVAKAPSM